MHESADERAASVTGKPNLMADRAAAMQKATTKKKPAAKSKWMDSSDENESSDEDLARSSKMLAPQ